MDDFNYDEDLRLAIEASLQEEDDDLEKAIALSLLPQKREQPVLLTLKEFQEMRLKEITYNRASLHNSSKMIDYDSMGLVINQLPSIRSIIALYETSKGLQSVIIKALEKKPILSLSFRRENSLVKMFQSRSLLAVTISNTLVDVRIHKHFSNYTIKPIDRPPIPKSLRYMECYINDLNDINPVLVYYAVPGLRIIFYYYKVVGYDDSHDHIPVNHSGVWASFDSILTLKPSLSRDDYSLFIAKNEDSCDSPIDRYTLLRYQLSKHKQGRDYCKTNHTTILINNSLVY